MLPLTMIGVGVEVAEVVDEGDEGDEGDEEDEEDEGARVVEVTVAEELLEAEMAVAFAW